MFAAVLGASHCVAFLVADRGSRSTGLAARACGICSASRTRDQTESPALAGGTIWEVPVLKSCKRKKKKNCKIFIRCKNLCLSWGTVRGAACCLRFAWQRIKLFFLFPPDSVSVFLVSISELGAKILAISVGDLGCLCCLSRG